MTVHYVYRCFDEQGRLLYVGQTRDVEQRMQQHRQKFWASQVRKIRVSTHLTPEIARAVERDAIRNDTPRFNLQGRWATRHTWDKQAYSDFLLVLTDGDLTQVTRSWRRNQIRNLLADYASRFGEQHILADRIREVMVEQEKADRVLAEQRRREYEQRMREMRERDEAEMREHRAVCCACMNGIVVDDELIAKYGVENALTAEWSA